MLRLKEIRQEKGITQLTVAEFLSISRVAYTNIENGKRDPDTQTLIKLAEFFDCSVDLLLGRAKKPGAALTPTEVDLVKCFRSLNEQGQEYIRQTMFMAQQIYKKSSGVSGVEAKEVG